MDQTIAHGAKTGAFKQIRFLTLSVAGAAFGLWAVANFETMSTPVATVSTVAARPGWPVSSSAAATIRPMEDFYLVNSPAQAAWVRDMEVSRVLEALSVAGEVPRHSYTVLRARTPEEEQLATQVVARAAEEGDSGPIVSVTDLRGR